MSAPSKEEYVQQELKKVSKKIDDEEQKPKGERDRELLEQWRHDKKELISQLSSGVGAGQQLLNSNSRPTAR